MNSTPDSASPRVAEARKIVKELSLPEAYLGYVIRLLALKEHLLVKHRDAIAGLRLTHPNFDPIDLHSICRTCSTFVDPGEAFKMAISVVDRSCNESAAIFARSPDKIDEIFSTMLQERLCEYLAEVGGYGATSDAEDDADEYDDGPGTPIDQERRTTGWQENARRAQDGD